jgi:hypothetical protein
MNPRTKIILVVAGSIITGLILLGTLVFFLRSGGVTGGEPNDPNNIGLNLPEVPYTPYTAPTGGVKQSGETGNAIIAAYVKSLESSESLRVGNVVTAGEYALLSWADDAMGGEALLKYDSVRLQWGVVANTGGAFGVPELRGLGVPQKTILALLGAMRQD